MATVNVVQQWWTSTTHQSHNYGSFEFKFGEGDNVPRINNPAKFSWDRIGCGGEIYGSSAFIFLFLSLFCFCFLATRRKPKPVNRFPCTMAEKTQFDVRECKASVDWSFDFLGSFSPKTPQISPAVGKFQPKWKSRITLWRLKIDKICQ